MLQRNGLEELRLGVDGYRETRRIALLKEHVASLEVQANGSEGEVGRRQSTLDNHAAILRDLERQHRDVDSFPKLGHFGTHSR